MKKKIDSKLLAEATEGMYWDTELKGFALKVTPKFKKVYVAEAKLKGTRENVRITIGDSSIVSLKQAREIAKSELFKITVQGRNPNAERKADRHRQELERAARAITLAQALEDYVADRKLKDHSAYLYRSVLRRTVSDWLDKPICEIDKFMIEERYERIKSSPGQANLAMRLISAIFNWAGEKYISPDGQSVVEDNPVKRLSRLRKWVTLKRRDDILTDDLLKVWYDSVMELKCETTRDLFLLYPFTGLRLREATKLTFDDCNFDLRTITINDPKNGQKHIIPMSDFVHSLLYARKQNRTKLTRFVFPSPTGVGPISSTNDARVEVRRSMARRLGIDYDKALAENDAASLKKVYWTVHGLRRTFLTIADSIGANTYTLKRLANHSTAGDVTAGYLITQVERLRRPMQDVAKYILARIEREYARTTSC